MAEIGMGIIEAWRAFTGFLSELCVNVSLKDFFGGVAVGMLLMVVIHIQRKQNRERRAAEAEEIDLVFDEDDDAE